MRLARTTRIYLTFLMIGVLFGPKQLGAQQKSSAEKGLKDYYSSYFPIGVAVTPRQLQDSAQRRLILTHFNSVTAENAMKMAPIHPEENRYNWDGADAIVNFAVENGLKVRGHTLCWHNQAPKWMFNDAAGNLVSKEVLLKRLREHIYAVVGRYKGKIYAWDVVNEAVADNPNELLRNSLWYKICGEDFIAKAFEYAHEADPKAILFYNDYNTEYPEKRQRIYKLLKKLIDAGVPVHAVGLQGHWSIKDPSEEMLKSAIRQYATLGIKVQVTELDVSIYTDGNIPEQAGGAGASAFTPELQRIQADQYSKFFRVFRDHKNVLTGVTFWNLSDRYSWLDNFPVRGRKNYPLLFDKDLQPKSAYWNVVKFQEEILPPKSFDSLRHDVPHGRLDTITYESKTVGTKRKAVVYLPPGYNKKVKYPVLYLLHGIGGDEYEWLRNGHPERILDNLYAAKNIKPMIVVMPNGRAMADDRATGNVMAGDKVAAFGRFERDLIDDLIPYVESRYQVLGDRAFRAIAGLSMGGGQALNFGLGNLGKFAWIGGFSSAPNTKQPEVLIPDVDEARKSIKLLWVSCGTEDSLLPISERTAGYLTKNNIPHEYYKAPGRHDFQVWKKDLYNFSQLLFK